MPELTSAQYLTVYNVLSLAIASMMATFVFFALVRTEISMKYRGAVSAGAMVVFIAGYHYFRIFNNWEAAYHINPDGGYSPSGLPFNNAYRYIDWMLTVPLLVVELVLILGLSRQVTSGLIAKLAFASFLMIILGYVGETDRTSQTVFSHRGLWGTLSTLPFVYILIVLLGEIRAAMAPFQPAGIHAAAQHGAADPLRLGLLSDRLHGPVLRTDRRGGGDGLAGRLQHRRHRGQVRLRPLDPCHRGASHRRGSGRPANGRGVIQPGRGWMRPVSPGVRSTPRDSRD